MVLITIHTSKRRSCPIHFLGYLFHPFDASKTSIYIHFNSCMKFHWNIARSTVWKNYYHEYQDKLFSNQCCSESIFQQMEKDCHSVFRCSGINQTEFRLINEENSVDMIGVQEVSWARENIKWKVARGYGISIGHAYCHWEWCLNKLDQVIRATRR